MALNPATIRFAVVSATPSPPPVGYCIMYFKSDNILYCQDSDGVEIQVEVPSDVSPVPNTVVLRDGSGNIRALSILSSSGNPSIDVTAHQLFDNSGNTILDYSSNFSITAAAGTSIDGATLVGGAVNFYTPNNSINIIDQGGGYFIIGDSGQTLVMGSNSGELNLYAGGDNGVQFNIDGSINVYGGAGQNIQFNSDSSLDITTSVGQLEFNSDGSIAFQANAGGSINLTNVGGVSIVANGGPMNFFVQSNDPINMYGGTSVVIGLNAAGSVSVTSTDGSGLHIQDGSHLSLAQDGGGFLGMDEDGGVQFGSNNSELGMSATGDIALQNNNGEIEIDTSGTTQISSNGVELLMAGSSGGVTIQDPNTNESADFFQRILFDNNGVAIFGWADSFYLVPENNNNVNISTSGTGITQITAAGGNNVLTVTNESTPIGPYNFGTGVNFLLGGVNYIDFDENGNLILTNNNSILNIQDFGNNSIILATSVDTTGLITNSGNVGSYISAGVENNGQVISGANNNFTLAYAYNAEISNNSSQSILVASSFGATSLMQQAAGQSIMVGIEQGVSNNTTTNSVIGGALFFNIDETATNIVLNPSGSAQINAVYMQGTGTTITSTSNGGMMVVHADGGSSVTNSSDGGGIFGYANAGTFSVSGNGARVSGAVETGGYLAALQDGATAQGYSELNSYAQANAQGSFVSVFLQNSSSTTTDGPGSHILGAYFNGQNTSNGSRGGLIVGSDIFGGNQTGSGDACFLFGSGLNGNNHSFTTLFGTGITSGNDNSFNVGYSGNTYFLVTAVEGTTTFDNTLTQVSDLGNGRYLMDQSGNNILSWTSHFIVDTTTSGNNIILDCGGDLELSSNFDTSISSNTFSLGSNIAGLATLVLGSVTISSSTVNDNSIILATTQTPIGVPGWLQVSSIVPGISFTITSSSGADASQISWLMIQQP